MENRKTKLPRTGFIFLIGLIVLGGLAIAVFALQQGARQQELTTQIDQMSLTLRRPLPSADKLKAEYDQVDRSLPQMTDGEAVETLVKLARESGIDVDPDSGMLSVPSQSLAGAKRVGDGNYGVLSFKGIKVQGSYDGVMALLSRLESGATLKTLVLKGAALSWMEINDRKDEARVKELTGVQAAMKAMMTENGIAGIPNPIDYAGGIAVNLMGDDPNTLGPPEGFPDAVTPSFYFKEYTGTPPNPKDGYVLYQHDLVDRGDTTKYTTVNYLPALRTEYYYVADQDGKVRQFDGPNIAVAREYGAEIKRLTLTLAVLDIDFYTRPIPKPPAKVEAKPPAQPPAKSAGSAGP